MTRIRAAAERFLDFDLILSAALHDELRLTVVSSPEHAELLGFVMVEQASRSAVEAASEAAAVDAGDWAAAATLAEARLAEAPSDDAALARLTRARTALGEEEAAAAAAERWIAVNPDAGAAYVALVAVAPERGEAVRGAMERLAVADDTAEDTRAGLLHAIARIHAGRGAHSAAYKLYLASKLVQNRPYDAAEINERWKTARDLFTQAHFERLAAEAEGVVDMRPMVFVVGLPGAGVEVVDAMFAAHPDVASAGAAGAVEAVARERADVADAHAAALYLQRLRGRMAAQAARVWVDATPENFLFLGQIATMFPSARFVTMARDPRDCYAACVETHFETGGAFASGIDRFAHYQLHQQEFADHWRGALGPRLLEIRYEDLAADPTAATRAALAHAGLAFDPVCTPEAGAPARAREMGQSGAVGAWRRYQAEFAELSMILKMIEVKRLDPAA